MQHVAKRRHHLLGFALAQQAVVNEDARELLADGARHQRGGDRRVDAAGERADHLVVADALADLVHRGLEKRVHLPVPLEAGDLVEEVFEDRTAVFACGPLRDGTARRRSSSARCPSHATLQRAVDASARYPSGSATTESPCDIHTRDSPGTPSNSGESPSSIESAAGPYSARSSGTSSPPSVARHELHAVADARGSERRRRGSRDPSRARRGASALSGPPERIRPAGSRADSTDHGVSYGTISQ